MYSFHLATVGSRTALAALRNGHLSAGVGGLRHAECLTPVPLGGSMAPPRPKLGTLGVFAEWDDVAALDRFLDQDVLGRRLGQGWHVRLQALRVHGAWPSLPNLPVNPLPADPDEPMVAVTLGRTRISQFPRFMRTGKPAENLAVSDPATVLAIGVLRLPNIVATLSIWESLRAMTDFSHGKGDGPGADAHIAAVREQRRKDFHRESAFIRLRPLEEHGTWEGRRLVPA